MIKVFCDICHQEMYGEAWVAKYKLRKRWWAPPDDSGWEKVTAHQKCIDELCEMIEARRKTDD